MSEQEDTRQNFIKAAERSFEHYKETDLHISLDDFSALGAQTVVTDPNRFAHPDHQTWFVHMSLLALCLSTASLVTLRVTI